LNPFKYGQIVKGKDFCCRPELEKRLTNEIKRGQNIYIQGERRTGKSSLVMKATGKVKKQRMVYIDLMEIKTSDAFLKRIITSVMSFEQSTGIMSKVFKQLSHLRPIASIDPISGLPTISLEASENLNPDSIPGVLELISSFQMKTRPLIVVFDEFQDILNLKNKEEVMAQLRSRIQFETEIPFIYVGSLRNKMDSIFNDPESAFFKSAIPIQVSSLDKKLFQQFILDKFNTGKRKASVELLNHVFDICLNVAGDIQQLCGAIWEISKNGEQVGSEHLPLALEQIFIHELRGYETILRIVSAQQLKVLTGLAKLGGKTATSSQFLKESGLRQASSAQAALNRLVNLNIIFRYENDYRFVNPFFRAWLLSKRL
jgi:uncharacterized protein